MNKNFFVLLSFVIPVLVLAGCITLAPPAANATSQSNEMSALCGGFVGISCPEGYDCEFDDPLCSDCFGKCVKVEVRECGGFTDTTCPDGFECAYNKSEEETIHPDAFGECVPALNPPKNVSGKCNLGQAYDVRSSKDVGCVCPDGYAFKRVTIGYFHTGNIEAPIPGVECVLVAKE